jgi:hypothetical protein
MNSVRPALSRRSFLLSTAAAISSPILTQADSPLHVAIVGFGRHASRFLESAPSSLLYVDAVFDPDPAALSFAAKLIKARQRSLPELVRDSRPTLLARSSSPVLLCSPPDTWSTLVPHLTANGRPVLAHHSQLFSMPSWPESLPALSRRAANLLLVGIDPSFPLHSLTSFHSFARSRGAANSSYSFWHPGWPESELLAFQFDCLNAALPQDVSPDEHRNQWQFLPMSVHPGDFSSSAFPGSISAMCSISAAGPGIAIGAHLEIAERSHAVVSSPEYFHQFANFCRASQFAKSRILFRQSALMEITRALTGAISLFA